MRISEAESRVLEALWSKAPLSIDQINRKVGKANGWAPNTVRTLITRLLKKKAIKGAREGDVYCYRPLIARSAWVQAESKGLLDRLFKGKVTPLVAHFAQHRALGKQDIQELKALIAQLETDDER
jgi:BlaI family penicillinase repressor